MTDKPRDPLTRERVLEGAVALADEIGVDALTMRKLAAALGVKPMTIYHHVDGKEEIIDGMVDLVFSEIDLPPTDHDWKSAIRERCLSARQALTRHRWAAPLMESRTSPGPATMNHHDAVIGCLRRGGLSLQLTAHAYATIDAFLYGFALQETSLPFEGGTPAVQLDELAAGIVAAFPEGAYPSFLEFTVDHVLKPGYSFGASFEFGLDLILDGLERASVEGQVG
ncbi:MAG: TetR/AcrR family transcriptional regulator C-terminal domain-containing protein [Acidimicrobiia bacterium]|nr:TetR/AcrR family transcriptional regulator C-terminal domain-containing protein [Acidimicrobiia bacterium]